MQTEPINHDPAHTFMNTGTTISGRPSMGSWVLVRAGRETEDLPGFVVLDLARARAGRCSRSRRGSGQRAFCRADSRACSSTPRATRCSTSATRRASSRDEQRDVDRRGQGAESSCDDTRCDDPEIATRIAQYEMAFRMQTSVPGLMDLSDEPQDCSRCTARSRATARSPPTACWPGGWPSAACASSSSITATGTTTATSRTTCESRPRRSTGRRPR